MSFFVGLDMNAIHRESVEIGETFFAPENITFGYQPERKCLSIWFSAAEQNGDLFEYLVIPTGVKTNYKIIRLVATVVMPDGFEAYHLIHIEKP